MAATPTAISGGGGGGGQFNGATSPAPMSLVIGAQLYSYDSEVFLGNLVPASIAPDSVCDVNGDYGSADSDTSIHNRFGAYGSADGDESAFNINATLPPIVLLDGEMLGTLTVSPFFIDAIDPYELLRRLECS